MPLTITITVPCRPVSINTERNQHRMKRAQWVKALRDESCELVAKALADRGLQRRPVMRRATIDVYPSAKDRRFRQDVANCLPSAKACIDGFVDAGLLTDDRDTYVAWIRFWPHTFGRDEMTFVVKDDNPATWDE